ncbi:MAG: diguanylate cyclase [Deltaproteobacteria bacterium]|nr:diguanylate cyclase [Deltaproteobacteria bacterium]
MSRISETTRELTIKLDRDTMNVMLESQKRVVHPSIIVVQGVDRGESVLIDKTPLIMGRSDTCDLIIRDDGISRIHAQIIKEGERYIIEDQGSTNGIFFGNKRVERHVLSEGDKVLVGRRTILKFDMQDTFDKKYQDEMYESAVRDGLTGVFNRKHFNERIVSELSFSLRHKSSLSVLIFDLDHFKRVNDNFGHQVGDEVLIQVSAKIHKILREEDFFARYGGEEFVVLARDIGFKGSVALGERIRQIIQDLKILTPEGIRVPVTLSIGVATVDEGKSISIEQFIQIADENLYKAKENGRNRVVASSVK